MFGWIKQIGITVQTAWDVILFMHDIFLYHIYPMGVFCKNVLFDSMQKFPAELAALALAFSIAFVVRFLWNAGRGAGA